MKLPAAVPRGARCTATAALLSVAIQLQATRVRSTAVTLSNVALPKDQNGEQLITGEASSMAHEGSWYFYFNNWGTCPGVDCCQTASGCASCCFNDFKNYTKGCGNLANGSDPYGLYHTVQAYKTSDFMTWEDLGVALPMTARQPGTEFRPCVVYNAKTKLFVMWYEDRGAGLSGYQVATSPTPQGPFTTTHTNVKMPGKGRVGDYNIFVDDDGIAYHVRTGFDLVQLDDTYTGPSAFVAHLVAPGEGPTMFKRAGTYYVTTGVGCCACLGGSNLYVLSAPSVKGPWTTQGDIGSIPGHTFDHHSPNNYVTKAQGSSVFKVGDQYVYLGNQWNSGLKLTPPGPRNHDLLYWGVFDFKNASRGDAPVIQQMVWHDTVQISL